MQYCQGKCCGKLLDFVHYTRYTLGKALMNIEYTFKNNFIFAQAYGTDAYSQNVYSYCKQTSDGCVPIQTTGAPNTGFLGLSQDAAIASVGGALLVAVAVAGAITVLVSRRRAHKKKTQE